MQPQPAIGDVDAIIERLGTFPVHSTRRSFARFTRTLRENFAARPELVIASDDLFLAGFPVASNASAWIHVASRSEAVLERELPAAWEELRGRLQGWKAETWLASDAQGALFARLGFSLARRMVLYRLDRVLRFPPRAGIRLAREADLPRLYEIHMASSDPREHLSLASYQELVEIMERTTVIEVADRIVGFAMVQRVEEMGLFQGLAVDPAAQGGGHGRALVEDALTYLADAGARVIELLALVEAVPARRLYESLGFVGRGEQLWMDCEIA